MTRVLLTGLFLSAVQAKGRRVKVKDSDGDAPAVFKWKQQRKK